MDNAGDWLYIVFLIIAGLGSLLKSDKKKKHPKSILSQPEAASVFEEKEHPTESKPVQTKTQNHRKQSPETIVPPKKTTPRVPASFLQTVETETASQPLASTSSIATSEEPEMPLIRLDNREDLQKAVIYAEILNRKY